MTITAAADGSALGNPGPAGWAWYVNDDCWHAGGWPHGTNNQGELMAVLDLFRATAHLPDEDLHILCDSQYVINSVTKWMPGWKRKGWRKSDGKPVLNVELLKDIDPALAGRKYTFEWVRGPRRPRPQRGGGRPRPGRRHRLPAGRRGPAGPRLRPRRGRARRPPAGPAAAQAASPDRAAGRGTPDSPGPARPVSPAPAGTRELFAEAQRCSANPASSPNRTSSANSRRTYPSRGRRPDAEPGGHRRGAGA